MIVRTQEDLEALKEIGRICALVRDEMAKAVRPGITTLELDLIAKRLFEENEAESAPMGEYDFPGYTCISVNDVVAHGIPSDYALKEGDKVNIDVSASKNGFFADTGLTLNIPPAGEKNKLLLETAKKALYKSIEKAMPGTMTNNLGRAVYNEAQSHGFTVIKNLTGHGVGKTLHDHPENIFNYNERRGASLVKEGHVLAIETFISEKDDYVEEYPDGWTLKTPHKNYIYQFEHTVVVTKEGPMILTHGVESDFYDPFV
ncbi:type I methionyl aminopeptidase [Proteiniclasticum ruminis]|uniref:type I methionyl aminopeptidase n=1 Tax=Proteiniclasticum ruminis TaxID=398199 RepID=UPI001B6EC269|nr:type I methionyl aminopeptidase [Proteiniclasticum ruminis]MBP9921199.1 type I methionyl aminopeptidase [Proteiniclasticum sp.]